MKKLFALICLIAGTMLVAGCVQKVEVKTPCQKDIEKAKEFAKTRFCAQIIAEMICPYNKSFSYVAKNICEMDFLKKKGWKKKIEISAKRKNLSEVKVAVIYQRINDNRPPERTLEKQIKILKELKPDFIFRAWWRWRPCPDSPETAEEQLSKVGYSKKEVARVFSEHYTYEDLRKGIEEIKKQIPNAIICGAIPAQRIDVKMWDEITGEVIPPEKVREMAFNPKKFNLIISFEEAQKILSSGSGYEIGESYFPDITNEDFQNLLVGWAKKQIDAGVDAIWIDALFTQARVLYSYLKDPNHPAVKESYEAACKIVDEIHKYALSKGKYVYVGTWAYAFVELPYEPCNIDFVTVTPRSREIINMKMDEEFWKDFVRKIREKLGSIPVFAFIDWSASDNAPMAVFSQKLTPVQQREMLKIMDNFFTKKGVAFVYPVHGGSMGKNARRLSFGKYIHYDALAPEFQTYETIKELALKKKQIRRKTKHPFIR